MDGQTAGTLSLVAGVVACALLLASLVDAAGRSAFSVPALLTPSLVLAALAIGFGLYGIREPHGKAGVILGHSAAMVGLVLGLVYAVAAVAIPILVLILILLFGWPYASWTCSNQSQAPQHQPCCSCCGPGSCNGCCSCGNCCGGCGDCGCGSCGGCGCGGGGCGCAALALGPMALAGGWAPLLDRLFAHHPDAPAFRADVYRVRGVRLCIGCFTTYPAFLRGSAALVALPGAWWALLGGGVALAALQGISSAGLARWKAVKVAVKLGLGLGLALLVAGTLRAPLAPLPKLGLLLGAMALAAASTIPRARRMRRAAAECACASGRAA